MAKTNSQSKSAILWSATIVLALGFLVLRMVFPEIAWASIAVGVLLLGSLGALIADNARALRTRSMAYGAQSAVTVVLVIGIVGVLNFLVSQHPLKKDLTRARLHTLSDDTARLMTGLKGPVKATLFSKAAEREQYRPLLENYKRMNSTKFEIEYVDPQKEQSRTKLEGIKKWNTLVLHYQGRDTKLEEVNEEKITNALIKLSKDKTQSLCVVTGHGERSFSANEMDSWSELKKSLESESYTVKDVSLVTDAKTLGSCDALAVVGPTKSFFAPEIQTLRDYLNGGGRALLALDLNLKGPPFAPELDPVLADWYVKRDRALVVDPFAQLLGGDAAMPRLMKYSTESPITRDFHAQSFAPFLAPIAIDKGAPPEVKATWLAQTDPQSWGITDLESIKKGVTGRKAGDLSGPLNAAAVIEGRKKDSKATRPTRLAVFGTSYIGTNNFSRFGGNGDLVLNAISWLLEDESFISIHPKEEGSSRLDLGERSAKALFLVNVILLPLLIAIAGVVIWVRRRRL